MGVGRVGVAGLTAALLGLGGASAVAAPAAADPLALAALAGRTTADPAATPVGPTAADPAAADSATLAGPTTADPAALAGTGGSSPAGTTNSRPKKKHHHHHRPRATVTRVPKPKPPAKTHHANPRPKLAAPKPPQPKSTTKQPAAKPPAVTTPATPPPVKLPPPVVLTGPALMLATGIAALKGTGYDVDITSGHDSNTVLTEHGSVDARTGVANLDAVGMTDGHAVHTDVRQIGNQLWALVNLATMQSTVGSDPNKWMLIDRNQLNDPNDTLVNLSGATDPLDIAGLMSKVSDLDQASPTRVTGMVDLTASTGVSAPTPEQLAFAGDVAAATPFEAAVDDQGRLVELKIVADSISPDLSRLFTFSRFGAPAPVTPPPAGQIMDAPDVAYQYFNGR